MESTASTVEVAEPMTEKAYDGGETISDEGERMQRVVATRTRSEKARVIARVCEDRTRESASEHHKEERKHAEGGGGSEGGSRVKCEHARGRMSGDSDEESAEEKGATIADNSDESASEDGGEEEEASTHRGQKRPLSDLDDDHMVHVPLLTQSTSHGWRLKITCAST
ncbi:hypothetical protein F443_07701 [Phytophthora nicotianae P1569]|uniref:Uncharacterized protein n=3 Tax=Phytophthora nicotianae TaxID=4792 RepID=V9FCX7_PHYNI|nr:hypothetical protein F443_07701 [Phytophthora nicotianae P1569]